MTSTVGDSALSHAAGSAAAVVQNRRRGRRIRPVTIVTGIVLAVLAFLWLLPFIWSVLTSLKSETEAASTPISWLPKAGVTLDAYVKVLSASDLPIWIVNSIITSVAITVITVVISALAGYAFSRIDFAGKRWMFGLIIATIIIPPQVVLVPLFREMETFGLLDTLLAVILPQVVAAPMVFILKRFFDAIPMELEDAARVDGANQLRVFLQIVLPLSRPILAAVSIFTFIGAWNNFLLPFIMTNHSHTATMPVGLQTIKSAYGIQYAQSMASAMIAALPLIIVFLIFQKQIIKGVATTGLGGQ